MTDPTRFERGLARAFEVYADRAPVDVDPVAMAHAAAGVATRPPGLRERIAALGPRRIATLGLVALLVLAAAITLAVAGRLLERPRPVFGEFHATGELAPVADRHRYVNAVATLADGRVLVMGSYDSFETPDAWSFLYDPRTSVFTPTGSLPEFRSSSTATTLKDGRVLVVGGTYTDPQGMPVVPAIAELYDPKTGTFEPTRGRLSTPRYAHTATLLADGRVLIAGGDGADFSGEQPPLSSSEVFDAATETFTPVGSMGLPRDNHRATRMADGRVLITGGMSSRDGRGTSSVELFDPSTGRFTPTGSMTTPRLSHAAVALADGRVLVAGGWVPGADPPDDTTGIRGLDPAGSAEMFDPATGRFTEISSLATERAGAGTALLPDGRVLVAGGFNAFGAPRTAELFDPATARFVPAGTSRAGHEDALTAVLPDGRVLVLGTADDLAVAANPEVWSPRDGRTALAPERPAPGPGFSAHDATIVLRTGHTATLLAEGGVLLTGGLDVARPGSETLSSAETFDPKTGRSIPVGDMSTPRANHGAVRLDDGRVLVAGGEVDHCEANGECTPPTPTVEIFDPVTREFMPVEAKLGLSPQRNRERGLRAVLLSDGHVLYLSFAGNAYLIDPATGQAPSTQGLPCATIALLRLPDSRVFAQCGNGSSGAYMYDPAGQAITSIDRQADWEAAIGLTDGRVLVLRTVGDAAFFDPATNAFSAVGPGVIPERSSPALARRDPYERRLTLLRDGRVLITGGRASNMTDAGVATADLFDPVAGAFASIGSMVEPRFLHSATLLDDGRVLLVGGVKRSPDRTDPEPAAVEIFDPAAVPRRGPR